MLVCAYPIAAMPLAMAYGRYVNNRRYFAAAALNMTIWCGIIGPRAYAIARHLLAGFDYLLLGALSFAVAAITSLFKTGWLQRRRAKHRTA